MKEKVLCAAIWFEDSEKNTYPHQPNNIPHGFVMCGHRHNSIFAPFALIDKNNKDSKLLQVQQGFLTNFNRFVDRRAAVKVALAAGQIKKSKELLYSEDIY